jgi:hypothetical protein
VLVLFDASGLGRRRGNVFRSCKAAAKARHKVNPHARQSVRGNRL